MSPISVILIEPNRRTARLIRTIVEGTFPAHVITVDEPDHLWSTLELVSPDLIIVDIASAQQHALQIPEHLKADPRTAEIPAISLGAIQDLEEISRPYGFSGHIDIPFTVNEFVEGLRAFIHPGLL